ncbi:MAG: hypothetical protein M3Y82_09250 [Verrucomicrobiota bacterium]|nr:hypothetical protein [Verrucomicrobiota bacterium]
MSTVKEIEAAIAKLKPDEIKSVAEWLEEFREEMWDRQIEADGRAGKLDSLIKEAKADYRAGKAKPFP